MINKLWHQSFCLTVFIFFLLPFPALATSFSYVIHISVDGLRPDAITTLGEDKAPNFYRLRNEGAFTDNARTDVDHTNTLPNHTSQLTGRGVDGDDGHHYTSNVDPAEEDTLHKNKGSYVSSVFDVAHDNGLSTGLYASKDKFVIFEQSYNATNGASAANGKDKIDSYLANKNTDELVANYLSNMSINPLNYSMLHLRDPDKAGHAEETSGWDLSPGSEYINSVQAVDGLLGQLLDAIEMSMVLKNNTAIILTSDHGGEQGTKEHFSATDPQDYTVPFYVWGSGVAVNTDLYDLNPLSRTDPGSTQPAYSVVGQPIRNGDAANLALNLLGLGPVPGSTINHLQNLNVTTVPIPAALPLMLSALLLPE